MLMLPARFANARTGVRSQEEEGKYFFPVTIHHSPVTSPNCQGVVVSCLSEYILLIFFPILKTRHCRLNTFFIIPDLYFCVDLINPSLNPGTSL
ncbi:hypothetical protein [Sphaerospermopsis sp. FACHB-1194]|nr:hypothetical protein [Sphaerospermopsis sp. FACHB-1194]